MSTVAEPDETGTVVLSFPTCVGTAKVDGGAWLACLALTLELMGFLLPSPVRRGTQDVVVDADRGPGEQEQEHRDGQQGQVAHDVPEVRGPHPGGEVATGAEAA